MCSRSGSTTSSSARNAAGAPVFCPYGIDTAEVTMIGRELLNLVGCNINWVMEPVANCFRTGNHLGIPPHGVKDMWEFMVDDIEDITGIKVNLPINKKGAEILFVTPSGDYFADPGTYTCMGYLMLFHELGLDYTWSTYASEGGNFGLFTSHEMIKRLNAKIYAEAKRLGVKWILGGECGHMWRVIHQYMDTMNGPADFLEEPVSPITGTKFENCQVSPRWFISPSSQRILSRHGKLKLDPSVKRQDQSHVSTTRATLPGPPVSWRSRDMSLRTSATTSSRCPRTPSGSRPSAVAAARDWAMTKTLK